MTLPTSPGRSQFFDLFLRAATETVPLPWREFLHGLGRAKLLHPMDCPGYVSRVFTVGWEGVSFYRAVAALHVRMTIE